MRVSLISIVINAPYKVPMCIHVLKVGHVVEWVSEGVLSEIASYFHTMCIHAHTADITSTNTHKRNCAADMYMYIS